MATHESAPTVAGAVKDALEAQADQLEQHPCR